MQYYIPQFIESESKVIGPLSIKQFFLIAGPITFIVILYFIFKNLFIVLSIGIVIVGGGIALALFKFQGQDLMAILSHGIMFLLKPKQYIWTKKGQERVTLKEIEKVLEQKEKTIPVKRVEESKLKKISWEIQTKPQEDEKEESVEENLPLRI